MSQELHYTSVPRGLLPGSRGFCTVACTPHMSGPLRERLESLSGYQQVYPPHDPGRPQPGGLFAPRLNLGGRSYSVLSRVGLAGLDYSSRSEQVRSPCRPRRRPAPAGGPAWLLSQPGFMGEQLPPWQGEPRFITTGRAPPQGDHPAGIADSWQSLIGDAGWAGTLAESFLTDRTRPSPFLEPGMDLLPLFRKHWPSSPSNAAGTWSSARTLLNCLTRWLAPGGVCLRVLSRARRRCSLRSS